MAKDKEKQKGQPIEVEEKPKKGKIYGDPVCMVEFD